MQHLIHPCLISNIHGKESRAGYQGEEILPDNLCWEAGIFIAEE